MTLADYLAAGTLPPPGHALILDATTRDAVLQAQQAHGNPQHQMQPVPLTDGRWGIGADVLTEASGLFAGTFQHLPRDLAAAVEVVSWQEFQSLLPVATPPAASEVGQEWTAPDGQLWRVMQARNPETGQFLADEPTTAAKESLTWAEVTS